MKLIISNQEFDVDLGIKILKLNNLESPYSELSEIWPNYNPITFKEIAQIRNVELRRVALDHYGIERVDKEVNPTLVSEETVTKKTCWINKDGKLEEFEYSDTYMLYKVDKGVLDDTERFYLKFKDTSTNRYYLLWVDMDSIFKTNFNEIYPDYSKINAIHAIAWTIQTRVPNGQIEEIIRQGDCPLFKKKPETTLLRDYRHLTIEEYLKFLVAES